MEIIKQIIAYVEIPVIVAALIYIGRKLQKLDDMNSTMTKVKHNIKIISDTLVQSKLKFDHTELQAYSPLQLTEKGNIRIRDVGFDVIVENNKKDFFEYIKSEKAGTKYDIELMAIKSIIVLFDKDYFNPVKNYLYNHPELDERALRTTLGIYLRDAYLKEHPEIK